MELELGSCVFWQCQFVIPYRISIWIHF